MSTCTIYLIENTIAELTIVRNFTDTVYPPLFWLENIAPSCCNTSVNWLHKSVGTGGGGATKLCKVTPPFFLVKIFYKSSPPPPFQFAPDAPASHNFHSIYSVEMKLYIHCLIDSGKNHQTQNGHQMQLTWTITSRIYFIKFFVRQMINGIFFNLHVHENVKGSLNSTFVCAGRNNQH